MITEEDKDVPTFMTSSLWIGTIVRGFLSYKDIVHMRFSKTLRGDAYELRSFTKLGEISASQIAKSCSHSTH